MDLFVVSKIRKRIAWLRSTLQEAKRHATSHDTFRESKRSKRYSGYATLMTNLIDYESSNCEEATIQQVWKDAMLEEY